MSEDSLNSNLMAILARIARTPVQIEKDGMQRAIPYQEALVNQIASAALKDPRIGLRFVKILSSAIAESSANVLMEVVDSQAQDLFDDPIVQREIDRRLRQRSLELKNAQTGSQIDQGSGLPSDSASRPKESDDREDDREEP